MSSRPTEVAPPSRPSPDSTTSPPRPSAASWTAPAPATSPTRSTPSRPPSATDPRSRARPQVTLHLPGLLADHLHTAGDDAVRQALATGRTIRRGQGRSVRLTAPLTLHHAALAPPRAFRTVTPLRLGRPHRKRGV